MTVLSPRPESAPAPPVTLYRLRQYVWHPQHGTGCVVLEETEIERAFRKLRVVFYDAKPIEGAEFFQEALGVTWLDEWIDLPCFPDRLNGHGSLWGLGLCEFAVAEEFMRRKRLAA